MHVSLVRACRGPLIHRGAYMGIYPWHVRVGAHSYVHACTNMCDGVRVGVYSYIYGHKYTYMHTACVSQAKTHFRCDENRKKSQKARKPVFLSNGQKARRSFFLSSVNCSSRCQNEREMRSTK